VRIYHGYEPRYTYTEPATKRTINIIDPSKIYPREITVREDDPSEFAEIGSRRARKWE
jgi:hypothetical protein